jgi:hypothetical protein
LCHLINIKIFTLFLHRYKIKEKDERDLRRGKRNYNVEKIATKKKRIFSSRKMC